MMWENKLTYPDGQIASYHKVQNGRYFELTTQTIKQDILHNVSLDTMG